MKLFFSLLSAVAKITIRALEISHCTIEVRVKFRSRLNGILKKLTTECLHV